MINYTKKKIIITKLFRATRIYCETGNIGSLAKLHLYKNILQLYYSQRILKIMSDNRKAWTPDVHFQLFQEDHAISTLVKKHGTHHWSEISKRMLDHFGPPGRTGKQCRER